MERIWLANYPAGIPADVSSGNYHSLADFIAEQCEKFGDAPAFENFGSKISYRQLNTLARQLAAYFQVKLNLEPGDRFAIMLPNILQFPIVLYAALLAGLIVVNVNPLYTKRELSYQLNDASVKAIFVMENFAAVVAETLPMTEVKHVIVTKMGDCLSGVKGPLINFYLKHIRHDVPEWKIPGVRWYLDVMQQSKTQNMRFTPVVTRQEDLAMLQYSGGTTGIPKGAMLSHKNILSNVFQCLAWIKSAIDKERGTVITALPLYHIFSLTGCFFYMAIGARALLITNPRDTKAFVGLLQKTEFHFFVGINTLFNALMNQPKFTRVDFSHLKLVISGGMALQKPVADRWQKLTKSVIIEGYGLTEASPVVSINPVNAPSFTGNVGMPIPSTEVMICDSKGQEVALGEIGELCVRGPQVMLGYWHQPKATKEAINNEGWLRTGDIARMDESGKISIVDRSKDMIIVSGFNVYPNEIEEVIMSHPKVKEVAVIGVPSESTGEAVKAFIVPQNGDLKADMILSFCHERLTNYKIPKLIEFRDELPKSNVGKVLRRELR